MKVSFKLGAIAMKASHIIDNNAPRDNLPDLVSDSAPNVKEIDLSVGECQFEFECEPGELPAIYKEIAPMFTDLMDAYKHIKTFQTSGKLSDSTTFAHQSSSDAAPAHSTYVAPGRRYVQSDVLRHNNTNELVTVVTVMLPGDPGYASDSATYVLRSELENREQCINASDVESMYTRVINRVAGMSISHRFAEKDVLQKRGTTELYSVTSLVFIKTPGEETDMPGYKIRNHQSGNEYTYDALYVEQSFAKIKKA